MKEIAFSGPAGAIVPEDLKDIESVLMFGMQLQPVAHEELKRFSQNKIRYFCYIHGIYQIVTHELVDFIQNEIGGASAIEIGSGNGCLGRALGIRRTDNRMQEWKKIRLYMEAARQPTIKYGADVERVGALKAIELYKPDVVVAAWVTHRWMGYDRHEDGNMYGVDEPQFEGKIKKYILVGNDDTHGKKDIMKFCVKKYYFEWLVSRATNPKNNCIYVFDFK